MGTVFGIMHDGWTHGVMRFVGVYALYMTGNRTLLATQYGSQDADAHIALFRNVLAIYNETVGMVQFIVADNCNTNRSSATRIGVPLVSCASRRFNLAANKFLTEHEPLLPRFNNLMSQLRQPNNAAELYKPLAHQETQHDMLVVYLRRSGALDIQFMETVEDFVPNGSEHKKCSGVLRLHESSTVCKRLQYEATTVSEVRLFFDSVVAGYSIMGAYLKPTSKIVHSPAFEKGLIKLAVGSDLSAIKKAAPSSGRPSTHNWGQAY